MFDSTDDSLKQIAITSHRINYARHIIVGWARCYREVNNHEMYRFCISLSQAVKGIELIGNQLIWNFDHPPPEHYLTICKSLTLNHREEVLDLLHEVSECEGNF